MPDTQQPEDALQHGGQKERAKRRLLQDAKHHRRALAAAMRLASSSSVRGSSIRASAMPTRTSSTEPLQNQSTIRFTVAEYLKDSNHYMSGTRVVLSRLHCSRAHSLPKLLFIRMGPMLLQRECTPWNLRLLSKTEP